MITDMQYILAGHSTFTIETSSERFTYQVKEYPVLPGNKLHFVSVLTGQDNQNDYTFIGTIFKDGVFSHGKKSPIKKTASSFTIFERWYYLGEGTLIKSGNCAKCGRLLTTPESVEAGIEPECQRRLDA